LNSIPKFARLNNKDIETNQIMTATLTYTLVLAAIYFGIKVIEVIEQKGD